MRLDYDAVIWRRALKQAAHFFRAHFWIEVLVVASGGFAALIATGDPVTALFVPIAGVVLGVVIIVVGNAAAAPAEVYREQLAQIESLTQSAGTARSAKLSALSSLSVFGRTLLAVRVTTEQEFRDWMDRHERLFKVALRTVADSYLPVHEATRLRYLQFRIQNVRYAFNSEHAEAYCGLSAVLDEIDGIIDRIERLERHR